MTIAMAYAGTSLNVDPFHPEPLHLLLGMLPFLIPYQVTTRQHPAGGKYFSIKDFTFQVNELDSYLK